MQEIYIGIIAVIATIVITLIVYLLFRKKSGGKDGGGGSPSTPKSKNYEKVMEANDISSLMKNFVVDNPNQDGTDPTGSRVDYSALMKKDKWDIPYPNVNGDVSWSEIDNSLGLIKNSSDGKGFILDIGRELNKYGAVPSVRLSSRKMFKGGLFVFDVKHAPIGCGLWPALWLNGYVGAPQNYHEKVGTPKYNEGMAKLAKDNLKQFKEGYSHECDVPLGNGFKPFYNARTDPFMSAYVGRPVHINSWPGGGEIDMLESINFLPYNIISIHGGPKCEVSTEFNQQWQAPLTGDKEADDRKVRSICGATAAQTFWGPPYNFTDDPKDPEYQLGPYSACSGNSYKIGGYPDDPKGRGGEMVKLPDGSVRPACPSYAAYASGFNQTNGLENSFGESFNNNGGGVFALQWIPKERLYMWFWSYAYFDKSTLEKSKGPLSNNPDPSTWGTDQTDKNGVQRKVMTASYVLNNPLAMTEGCDFTFQNIILNIAVGGGWAENGGDESGIQNCTLRDKNNPSVFNRVDYGTYLKTCLTVDPANADESGVDPDTGCADGAYNRKSKALFFSQAYFDIKSIRVFQRQGDDNVW